MTLLKTFISQEKIRNIHTQTVYECGVLTEANLPPTLIY